MFQHAKVIAMNLGLLAESLMIMVSARPVFLSNVTGQVAAMRALQEAILIPCHKCTVIPPFPFSQNVAEGPACQNC